MSENFQTLTVAKYSNNQSVAVYCVDSDGNPKTGLLAADVSCFISEMSGQHQSVNVRDLTDLNASHVGGGFIEVSAINVPGLYRFDIPDAVFNADRYVIIYLRCSEGRFTLTGINVADARLLTSELPANVINRVLYRITDKVLSRAQRRRITKIAVAELQRL